MNEISNSEANHGHQDEFDTRSDGAVKVASLDDLVDGEGARFDVRGHRLSLVRLDSDVYVIGDQCSHADFSLSEGEVDADELTLECWKHGSTFSLTTGEPTCFPAVEAVPTYNVDVVDGTVWVLLNNAEEVPA